MNIRPKTDPNHTVDGNSNQTIQRIDAKDVHHANYDEEDYSKPQVRKKSEKYMDFLFNGETEWQRISFLLTHEQNTSRGYSYGCIIRIADLFRKNHCTKD